MKRWLLFLIIPVLGGCALLNIQRNIVRHTYSLELPAYSKATPPANKPAVSIRLMEVAPLFENQQFVYRLDQDQWQQDYYNLLLISPAENITRLVRQRISHAGIFSSIGIPGLDGGAPFLLQGYVENFYGDYQNPDKPEADVRIRFVLLDQTQNPPHIVFQQSYHQRTNLRNGSPQSLVEAWSQAIGEILNQLIADLKQQSKIATQPTIPPPRAE